MVLFLTQCLVPFSLFSGLRCWELAFEGSSAVHLGVDNLNVVRHVARILDGGVGNKPSELCVGGDLLTLTDSLVLKRCTGSVRITKVKGHADDAMVQVG